MYKSPIEIIYGQAEKQMENDILRAVQSYGINVDKSELIRALQYDRNQYNAGYAAGRADAMAELVRCKDCDFACEGNYGLVCTAWGARTDPNMFCGNGERKDDE